METFYDVPKKEVEEMISKAAKEGVLLWIDCGFWGNRTKVDEDIIEQKFGTNYKKSLKGSIDLVNREETNLITYPITKARTELLHYYKTKVRVRQWIRRGIYWAHRDDIEEINRILLKADEESKNNLEKFLNEKYDSLIEEEKERRPEFFQININKFPSKEKVRYKYRFRWGFEMVNIEPGNELIKIMGKEQYEEEVNLRKKVIVEAMEEEIKRVRLAFTEIIVHLSDVLKDPNKKFKDSTIEKPKEFLSKIKDIVVWNDKPFELLGNEALDLLDGVEGNDLREDSEYRKIISEALDEVVQNFKELPVTRLTRSLEF